MASTLRPLLMRQACCAAPARRCLQTKAATSSSPPPLFSSAQPRIAQAFRPSSKPSLTKAASPSIIRVAGLHATSRNAILPPLPQRINGTANEAAPIPTPSPSHGAYHWTMERGVSVLLIPVTVAPFAGGSAYPVVDALLCGLLVIHSHIGFQSIITDYIPSGRLPKTRITFDYGLYVASAVVAFGLYEFETNDVGLTEGIAKIWRA